MYVNAVWLSICKWIDSDFSPSAKINKAKWVDWYFQFEKVDMFSPFLLWPRAPSWLRLAHCSHPDLEALNWTTICVAVDSMHYPLFRFRFCTRQSCSIFASFCNTIVSSYDPLMEKPVFCCCWRPLYCRGDGRTSIAVEESLPVNFAKSLTEIFPNESKDWDRFLIFTTFFLGCSTLIFRESISNPRNSNTWQWV